MTTNSDSGHCIPTKAFVSRDHLAEDSDFMKKLNSEIDPQAFFSGNEEITVDDTTVSSEDSTVDVEMKQIKESSFVKEIGNVHKIDEVDETEKAFQQVEHESIAPNGKESLNLVEKEQVSEARRLLEAEKKRLLAEIEHGSIFGKSVDLGNTMKQVQIKDNSIDNRSMEVELIDDIALVDVVPFNMNSNDYDTKRRGTTLDKDVPRKHTKIGEKKPIDKGNASNVVEGIASAKVFEFHIRGETNGRILYSREQLELMRFASIVNQRELWSEMYARLLPEVVTEYESLVCLNNQKTSKSNRRQRESRIGDNLGTDEETEDLTPEDYIDDNDDYKSILKPAFEVEGEPDFSTEQPEDGFEYLRRVRWEAKGIPNVRIAKVDQSKYIKKEQSVYMPVIPEIPKCPDNLLPVKEWEDLLLSDFLHLRQALSENINWCEDEVISSQSGEDLLVEIFNKRLHTEKDESFGVMVADIQGMDSVTRISNLKRRVCLVEKESGLQSCDCKWVVALCASLETPLDADTCACLRGLLRKCASVRAEKSLDVVDEEVIMANILITIAGRYFGQMGQ